MPKTPIDFSKTIIYKIWKDDDFYVGSTTDFASRKSKHKYRCNTITNTCYNLKLYETIREKGGWNSWEMIPLEEYFECQNSIQTRIREEEWRVKLNADLNMRKAYTLKREYNVEYHQKYRQEHTDKIKTLMTQKFDCECGGKYTYHGKSQHQKTKKHQKYLEKE